MIKHSDQKQPRGGKDLFGAHTQITVLPFREFMAGTHIRTDVETKGECCLVAH